MHYKNIFILPLSLQSLQHILKRNSLTRRIFYYISGTLKIRPEKDGLHACGAHSDVPCPEKGSFFCPDKDSLGRTLARTFAPTEKMHRRS